MTSHSSRGTFRACKRKYHWSYIKGLQQDRKPKALRMGSAWSDGLEHGRQAIEDYYRELMMNPKTPEWDLKDASQELAILLALYDTYPFPRDEAREVGFRHIGPNYEDRGQLDGLELEIIGDDTGLQAQQVAIIENKLYARFGNQEIEKLEYDEQVTSYVAAVVDNDIEGYEFNVTANDVKVKYRVTLKPGLRQKVNESDKDYTARCVADILARPDHYHREVPTSRDEVELQDFRERRDKHVMDLMYETEMGVWERSPSNCFDYGQCPFLKICRTPNLDKVPEGYTEREARS